MIGGCDVRCIWWVPISLAWLWDLRCVNPLTLTPVTIYEWLSERSVLTTGEVDVVICQLLSELVLLGYECLHPQYHNADLKSILNESFHCVITSSDSFRAMSHAWCTGITITPSDFILRQVHNQRYEEIYLCVLSTMLVNVLHWSYKEDKIVRWKMARCSCPKYWKKKCTLIELRGAWGHAQLCSL